MIKRFNLYSSLVLVKINDSDSICIDRCERKLLIPPHGDRMYQGMDQTERCQTSCPEHPDTTETL